MIRPRTIGDGKSILTMILASLWTLALLTVLVIELA
jgi:hypothetical protein